MIACWGTSLVLFNLLCHGHIARSLLVLAFSPTRQIEWLGNGGPLWRCFYLGLGQSSGRWSFLISQQRLDAAYLAQHNNIKLHLQARFGASLAEKKSPLLCRWNWKLFHCVLTVHLTGSGTLLVLLLTELASSGADLQEQRISDIVLWRETHTHTF